MADLTPREIEKYDDGEPPQDDQRGAVRRDCYASRVAVNSEGAAASDRARTRRRRIPAPPRRLRSGRQLPLHEATTTPVRLGRRRIGDGSAGSPSARTTSSTWSTRSNRRIGVWTRTASGSGSSASAAAGAYRLGGDLRGSRSTSRTTGAYVVDNGQGQIEKFRASTGQCLDTSPRPSPTTPAASGSPRAHRWPGTGTLRRRLHRRTGRSCSPRRNASCRSFPTRRSRLSDGA